MNSNSSHDSLIEDAQTKACLKMSSCEILGDNNHPLRSESLTINNYSAIKFDDPRGLECHDGNISSTSGAEQTNLSSISVIQTERVNISPPASADSLAVERHCNEVLFKTASGSLDMKFDSDKLTDNGFRALDDKCASHSSSLMKREEVCDIKKPASCISEDIHNNNARFVDEKLEIRMRNDVGDLPDEGIKCEEQNREIEKVGDFPILPEAKTTSFQSHHMDESDESDIVELDVKVCDICGDPGREDLLATCCRCIDGAEHTYCMRVRLEKVPERDWLCEECKCAEEIDTRRQDKSGTEEQAEKDLPSELEATDITTARAKLDAKVSDLEGNKTNQVPSSAKALGKRPADDIEVSRAAKRQAVDPVITSPKAINPDRARPLSRDSSFKNFDREKEKRTQQFSSGTRFQRDTPEVARTGGGFLKSKSFNFSSAKSKVKIVDEVPHKHGFSKEGASRDAKGALRGIDKSLSFKSINSARLSTSESDKILSPRLSHVQDLKGSNHTSEKSSFERKHSFRSPRSLINPTTSGSTISGSKGDKKLTSRGESVSLSSKSNAELKDAQSTSRSISNAKLLNHGPHTVAEVPSSTGVLKRQLSSLGSRAGALSPTSLAEKKDIKASMKDESLSKSHTDEDEVPQAKKSTKLSERRKDSPTSDPRQSIDAAASRVPCHTCKEIGHSTQNCKVDSHSSLGFDSSVPRTSKVEINRGGSKLKAAIEAAMLKKPSIYRKNRTPQTDEISVSNSNKESAFPDQPSNSSSMRSMNSAEVIEGKAMRKSDANSSKLPNGTDAKQLMVTPGDALSASSGDLSSVIPSARNMELSSQASAAMLFLLQMSAIPDHECIWQGSFEVKRGRKTSELWDGFQAHLSNCASPKVIEAVSKFHPRVLLNEIPRLSVWPIQFEENGVKEDNIALYFFAREFESYERSYKVMLERMMRSDLALRGNIDGIELLILPSNQLPKKSQRWNNLFFFWGVFRGEKQKEPVSPKKLCSQPGIADAIVSLPSFSSVETKIMEKQDCISYPSSSTPTHFRLDESSPLMLAHIDTDTRVDRREIQASMEATSAACGSNTTTSTTTMSEKVACNLPFPADRQHASANNNNRKEVVAGAEEGLLGAEESVLPEGVNCWPLDSMKRKRLAENMSQVPYAAGTIKLWDDANKKQKIGSSVMGDDPASTGMALSSENKNGERFFFPLIDLNLDEEPIEEEEESLEVAKLNTCRVGKLDINLDEPPPPEEDEEEEALSLSLSFPKMTEKEMIVPSIACGDAGKSKCKS